VTVGGDKGFHTRGFVAECRNLGVTPRVAQNHARPGGSAIDGRTTRHLGYAISQRKRKRIEECFAWLKATGWLKTIALMRKLRRRGVCKVDWIFAFACAAFLRYRSRPNSAAFVLTREDYTSGVDIVMESLRTQPGYRLFRSTMTPALRRAHDNTASRVLCIGDRQLVFPGLARRVAMKSWCQFPDDKFL